MSPIPRVRPTRFLLLAMPLALGCFGSTAGTPDGGSSPPGPSNNLEGGSEASSPGACTPSSGAKPPTAPNGYYTNGSSVCTDQGDVHLFHGVDRPTLEWCYPSSDTTCTHLTQDDVKLMASWGTNIIRVALDQDRWLSSNVWMYDPDYAKTVDQVITWAEAECMDVILDLHWSDQGDLTVSSTQKQGIGYSNQQPMADVNSIEFWKEVASKYRGDGHVLFELYNEPEDIPWNVWLHGGTIGPTTYVGMQNLYDTIRNDAHADNIVIAGGVHWAFDLSGVASNPVTGYNIMYASHVYKQSNDAQAQWDGKFGYLAQSNVAPVILTEFGDGPTNSSCTGDWDTTLIQYANQLGISWTAWAWYVPGNPPTTEQLCAFPALISDWSGTPSVQGVVVKQALAAYPSAQCTQSSSDGGRADGATAEGGSVDGSLTDAGVLDTASADGARADAPTTDAGSADATTPDAAPIDATTADGGGMDASSADSASPDATTVDGGALDAGIGEAGSDVANSADVLGLDALEVDTATDTQVQDGQTEADASADSPTTD